MDNVPCMPEIIFLSEGGLFLLKFCDLVFAWSVIILPVRIFKDILRYFGEKNSSTLRFFTFRVFLIEAP